MNKLNVLLVVLIMMASIGAMAQVAINTDGSDPNASAMLDVKATSMGFLPPRVADTNAISTPEAGLLIFDLSSHCMRYYSGTIWSCCMGCITSTGGGSGAGTVTNCYGSIWKDKNLGASQVATSSNDANAYGDLYQWGRATEGHEQRNSTNYTSGLASTAQPSQGNAWDGQFIPNSSSPYDWLSTQDNTLWQGVNGTNNPCPAGFRLPTDTEWNEERKCWSSQDAAGAYASTLKLTVAGYRLYSDGSIIDSGSGGNYWSSTINGTQSNGINFFNTGVNQGPFYRSYGFSIRCIKD